MVADEDEWGAGLWAMADLTTPMAVRVAAQTENDQVGQNEHNDVQELCASDAGNRHGVLHRDPRYVLGLYQEPSGSAPG